MLPPSMKPTYIISAMLVALLLYPLSFGPVVWMSRRMDHRPEMMDSFGREFYYPLVRLAEQNQTTCQLLIWYQFLVLECDGGSIQ
ncbi:hypothetical protein CfE428DRAFT_4158 [Chthoniobacter flavus Ellin428]|uniref:Uncharacterized protein n=1 Tax=Chthoniobacter flavus Ellin428 TaxID=497964 RepID=B4D5G9_9BACT|nr:hypothetical protein CfE428DRAFT_4158 [Chthoniobacter flavus Ellin428]TCO91394.1 hypothetical protein EV701_108122 [Chthoniobacter flavus]